MRRHPIAIPLALLGAAALTGCGALDPYPTYPQTVEPRPGLWNPGPGNRVAICYNSLSTTPAEVHAQAQQECVAVNPRTRAEPIGTDWYLENCPLLVPERATFECTPYR